MSPVTIQNFTVNLYGAMAVHSSWNRIFLSLDSEKQVFRVALPGSLGMPIKHLFKYWTYQIFSPGTVLRKKYKAFKALLGHDKRAHELMAELEEIYYDRIKVDFSVIEKKYSAFSRRVRRIVENLQIMNPSRYLDLMAYYKKFDFYIRFMLADPGYDFSPPFTLLLPDVSEKDGPRVGGKTLHVASIGYRLGLPIPPGFVVTTSAFYYFLEYNDFKKVVDEKLADLDINDTASLNRISAELVALITKAQIPPDIAAAITTACGSLGADDPQLRRVAVRSSAVGEDGSSSFAGQYKTVLNTPQEKILEAYKEVIASKYSPEALYCRINFGLTDMETPMAVLVLKMIAARTSGVMYTVDLDEPGADLMAIHATWGLGELLVQGEASPDIFQVRKSKDPTLQETRLGAKSSQMVFADEGGIRIAAVPPDRRKKPSLTEPQVLTLARWGLQLEAHYGEPQDVEWCLDSAGELVLLQARPLKIGEDLSPAGEFRIEAFENPVLLSGGDRASSGVGAGTVFKVRRESDLARIPEKAVLVARHASSGYVKVMGKLSAVVTDTGSTAGHLTSVAREFGVPALVNTAVATERLESGREVTVYADEKKVYAGVVPTLVENRCIRADRITDSPFTRKLEYVLSFVAALRLVDPEAPEFTPEGCRSMHDIIRFAHEKSVQEMFTIGNRRIGRKMGAKKLISPIPMLVYLLDVGQGLAEHVQKNKEIQIGDIHSRPLLAVWKGLSHPAIQWSQFSHFNWEEYDRIVMSGGIISADSAQLASYAVLSREYLNLNLKFGYHFVILDTVCSERAAENHIFFRFAGGGGDHRGRSLRTKFLCRILERLAFEVNKKSDLVDAKYMAASQEIIAAKLDMLGRLLGATRLMDMYLKQEDQVAVFAEEFLKGRYHFSSVAME